MMKSLALMIRPILLLWWWINMPMLQMQQKQRQMKTASWSSRATTTGYAPPHPPAAPVGRSAMRPLGVPLEQRVHPVALMTIVEPRR